MLRSENTATPPTAVTVVVPESVAPVVPLPAVINTDTSPVKPVTTFPMLSSAVTSTAGVMTSPAVVEIGCTVKISCVAAAGVMSKGALVAFDKPLVVARSRYPTPALLILSVENAATPAFSVTAVVPDSVPLEGFVLMVIVTVPVKLFTVLPCASCAATWTAGMIVAPAGVVLGGTMKPSLVAAPTLIVKVPLRADGKPVAVADSRYPVPALSMLRVEKEATPATADTVVVPDRMAPGVPVPGTIATFTCPVNVVMVCPSELRAVTWTAGVILAPAVVVEGCTVKTSVVFVTSNGVLVAPGRPPAAVVSVYPLPTWSMLRVEKVATPATAATVVVPDSVPPPGFAPIAMVTLPVNAVAVFPKPSRAVTWTAGVMTPPALEVVGCTVKASCVAEPGVMVNAVLPAVVRPAAPAWSV